MRNVENFGIVGKVSKMVILVLQVDYGDMRNLVIVGKDGKVSNAGAVGRLWPKLVKLVLLVLQVDYGNMRYVYKFGIVGKAGKNSTAGAVGRLQ